MRTVHATRDALDREPWMPRHHGQCHELCDHTDQLALRDVEDTPLRALAGSLRGEIAKYGVAVTLIAPGFVDSEIRQVGNRDNTTNRIATPSRLAVGGH